MRDDSFARFEAAVRDLAPRIGDAAPAMDAARAIPAPLVDAIARSPIPRMWVPRALGGEEATTLDLVKTVRAIAEHDAATAWVAAIYGTYGVFAGYIPAAAAAPIFGPGARGLVAGSVNPTGKALRVDGGYRLSGRWTFGSGVSHASWVIGTAVVYEGDAPRLDAAGQPDTRVFLVPRESVVLHDTWRVSGLRATSSDDYSIADAFVPADRAFSAFRPEADRHADGALYRHPFSVYAAPIAAVALGTARGAIDAFVAIATRKTPMGAKATLAAQPSAQSALARAEALVRAATCLLDDAVARMYDAVATRGHATMDERGALRLACAHAATSAVDAVDLVCREAGTAAMFESHGLERRFRDVHAAAHHISIAARNYEICGRILLGFEPGTARF